MRSYLGAQGMKKGAISKFIEETVREAREAFADVPPDHLQKRIDDAVYDARAKRYREHAQRS